MTCVHRVKWSVKRPEDCRFRLSVSHYKDRIVAPDEYSGATVVTPTNSEQVLPTTDKLVRDDITVNPAPTEYLSTDHNGTFMPSDGKVGFYQVDVDVVPDLRPLSVDPLTQQGVFTPTGDGFSQVTVENEWDDTLYPIPDDSSHTFNCKHVSVSAGDVLILDGFGEGSWWAFNGGKNKGNYTSNRTTYSPYGAGAENGFVHVRWILPITQDTTIVVAGYEWSPNNGHSGGGTYNFRGEYMHYKVIHAT